MSSPRLRGGYRAGAGRPRKSIEDKTARHDGKYAFWISGKHALKLQTLMLRDVSGVNTPDQMIEHLIDEAAGLAPGARRATRRQPQKDRGRAMTYYGNSTSGADQGQDVSYDSAGWECPHCNHIFWTASAWSINEGDALIGGVLCPECNEFIADDELRSED